MNGIKQFGRLTISVAEPLGHSIPQLDFRIVLPGVTGFRGTIPEDLLCLQGLKYDHSGLFVDTQRTLPAHLPL
jgi:hypothetical protein